MKHGIAGAVLFVATVWVSAQPKSKPKDGPPKPLYPTPLAIDVGKTSKVTLRGLRFDNVTDVRLHEPKSKGKVLGKSRKVAVPNQMNAEVVGDSELDVEITLPAEGLGGVVALSLMAGETEGPTVNILVNDDTPRLTEKEPNDGFKQPQRIVAPQIVEATIRQNQDVDVYRLDAKAGTTYRIEVQAKIVGSPVDAMLTVYDSAGRTLATGETKETHPDPVLKFTPVKDGPFFITVLDNHDQGGPMFHYRLAVRTMAKP